MNADEPERDLRAAIRCLAVYGDDGARRIAGGAAAWLAGHPEANLEEILGFLPRWRFRRDRRDQASRLIAFRQNHFGGLQGREAARAVASELLRYEAGSWPRHRDTGRRPDGRAGELYDICGLGQTPGVEMLRKLFRGRMGAGGPNSLILRG